MSEMLGNQYFMARNYPAAVEVLEKHLRLNRLLDFSYDSQSLNDNIYKTERLKKHLKMIEKYYYKKHFLQACTSKDFQAASYI